MLKVAILDDYQNVSQEFVDLKNLSGKYEFKIFSEPFLDEAWISDFGMLRGGLSGLCIRFAMGQCAE